MKEQIEQYFTNDISIQEEVELLKRVDSDKELKTEFARLQNIRALYSFSDTLIDEADSRRAYRVFLSRKKRQKVFRLLKKSIGYAAAILFTFITVRLYYINRETSFLPSQTQTSLFVPAGQRVNLTLQDGTVVWLNSQSRLTYPAVFNSNERRVSIEGEAYFEVAPDKQVPFIVSTGEVDIKVLGTAFNVYSYKNNQYSKVSLIEGSLQVYYPSREIEGVILKPDQEITIREDNMTIGTISDPGYFLWKEGLYSFENENLDIILKKLELYYDITIIVNNPEMLRWKYTVKFRQRDGLDEILRLMQKIHPFKVHKDEEKNQIMITK